MCYEVAQCDKLTHLFCLCVVDSLNNGKAAIHHLKKIICTDIQGNRVSHKVLFSSENAKENKKINT